MLASKDSQSFISLAFVDHPEYTDELLMGEVIRVYLRFKNRKVKKRKSNEKENNLLAYQRSMVKTQVIIDISV